MNKKSKTNKTKTVSARITQDAFDKCKDQGIKISKVINDAINNEIDTHKVVLVNNGNKSEFKRVKIER